MGNYRKKVLAIGMTLLIVLMAFTAISTSASAMTKAELIDKIQSSKGMPEITKKAVAETIESVFENKTLRKEGDDDDGYTHYSYGNYKIMEDENKGKGNPGFDTLFLVVTSYKRDGEYFIIKYTVIVVFTDLTLEQWCQAIELGFSDRPDWPSKEDPSLTWTPSEDGRSYSTSVDMDWPSEEDPSLEPPSDDIPPSDDDSTTGDDPWKVVNYLRDYYIKYGIAPMIRKLCNETGYKLKPIYELFPSGPAKGACKVAGLPKPTGCV